MFRDFFPAGRVQDTHYWLMDAYDINDTRTLCWRFYAALIVVLDTAQQRTADSPKHRLCCSRLNSLVLRCSLSWFWKCFSILNHGTLTSALLWVVCVANANNQRPAKLELSSIFLHRTAYTRGFSAKQAHQANPHRLF